ncbi:MAG: serine hydrolase [Lachnospiraceae bacterium]|nr:serine hydrolase [Lachnospiraceae bacterium]
MLLAVILLLGSILFPTKAEAALFCPEGPEIFGEGYCIYDMTDGKILAGHHATSQYYPASITKVLTALIVLEHVEDLNQPLTFSHDAVTNITSDSSTLNPKAKEGEVMTVHDALYGLMLASGNECANALAEHVSGSVENFAVLMNEKAAEIGCVNSHFVNPHGLQDINHYTCPYDMTLIFAEALKNPTFVTIDSTPEYVIGATNLTAARKVLMGHAMINGTIPYEGVFAGKTGRTPYAGRTLLTAFERNGHKYSVCLMKSNDQDFYLDAQILLDYICDRQEGEVIAWTECKKKVWTLGNVNARDLPSVHSHVLYTAKKGTPLEMLEVSNMDFARVTDGEKTFYMSKYYLIDADPVKNAAAYEQAEKDLGNRNRGIETEEHWPVPTAEEPEAGETIAVGPVKPDETGSEPEGTGVHNEDPTEKPEDVTGQDPSKADPAKSEPSKEDPSKPEKVTGEAGKDQSEDESASAQPAESKEENTKPEKEKDGPGLMDYLKKITPMGYAVLAVIAAIVIGAVASLIAHIRREQRRKRLRSIRHDLMVRSAKSSKHSPKV